MNEPFLTEITNEDDQETSPRSCSILPPDSPDMIVELPIPRSSTRQYHVDLGNTETGKPTIISTPRGSITNLIINLDENRRAPIKRSYSASPFFTNERNKSGKPQGLTKNPTSTPIVVQVAFIAFITYIVTGVLLFVSTNSMFSGHKTIPAVDGLYFLVVTLCTIGYGDITPQTTITKLFTCVFILVGFGIIGILLNGLVSYVLDRQETVLLGTVDESRFTRVMTTYVIDVQKGRMRIRTKVGLAMAVVVVCLLVGTLAAHYIESINWVDSFYLSVTSVTTVGYGDYHFSTLAGRCFAIVWLLVSTFAVARAFLYLTEFRLDKRNRRVAQWVLQRKMTRADIVLADLDRTGSVSKSEYVLFKLKEMGKITDSDIQQICRQFDSLETSLGGRITLANVKENDDDDDDR